MYLMCSYSDQIRGAADEDTQMAMPSEQAMKQKVQRSRRAALPPVPKTLPSVQFAGVMSNTDAGQPFLFYDSGQQV